MLRRHAIFKILSRKHAENILGFIYQNEEVEFTDICQSFPKVGKDTVRKVLDGLGRVKLIKCVSRKSIENPRRRVYIIRDTDALFQLSDLQL